ncbi:MAG TPA: cob(I)yrinic acid a,c-diamide adenosyltransferase [Bdellovibrionales bacterium]|nr:cob(I)yrinic acid a,c-diamide adenosyltransferase [Bdellovibrionales bacterium]
MKARIYTKTGDQGQTSLVGGSRVAKSNPRIEAYGTVDELNSVLGLIRAHLDQIGGGLSVAVTERLQAVQNNLFNVGSRLACESDEMRGALPSVTAHVLSDLETDMDRWESELPALREFILPGGAPLAAFAHLGRTVCRRAEREVLRVREQGVAVDSDQIILLNRLSDWLFVLARKFNASAGVSDVTWSKG